MLLSDNTIANIIQKGLDKQADFVEIFAENKLINDMFYQNDRLENANLGVEAGIGIRLLYGTESIYLTSNSFEEKDLIALIDTYKRNSGSESNTNYKPSPAKKVEPSYIRYRDIPSDQSYKSRMEFMETIAKKSKEQSSLVQQVEVKTSFHLQEVQIANSEGLHLFDTRPYTSYLGQCISRNEKDQEMGFQRGGSMTDLSLFEKGFDPEAIAKKITDQSIRLLDAEFAPAGEMPVILSNGFGGVIFHEACGHGLETTSVAADASVFCGQLDKQVASSVVTAIDDGTIDSSWGSIHVDDEGMKTQKTTLIENGILKRYIVDRVGHLKTGFERTGSGRRESYKFAPTSRMRNTYIAAGDSSLEEMIRDVDFGLYATDMGGGSVSPGTGDYNFAVKEGRVIRNGKLEELVKGASLIGRGIDTLKKIDKVGNDIELANGTCGSSSGWVPVTVGQPSLLVSKLTVGGRAS
ncbi:MAG: TldD/PmbA family protein [Bdellovibrionales bacterium]